MNNQLDSKPKFSTTATVTLLQFDSLLGTLGPEYTFHDILRRKHYDHAKVCYYNDFDEIFKALANNDVEYALVALSNSIHGDVDQNNHRISKMGLSIIETHDLPINLHLTAKSLIAPSKITKVYAHPIAKNECHLFFESKKAVHIACKSNVQALEALNDDDDQYACAISGREAIEQSDMVLIKENIHNSEPNITTFALITKK